MSTPPKTPAERAAAYRARKGKGVGLLLADDIKQGLDAYVERQRQRGQTDMTLSRAIEQVVRSQLLRKR